MRDYDAAESRRFYRSADRCILGGVCGGLAGYFGCNLKVTRILAIVALFMAPPFAVMAYLGAVVFLPAAPSRPPAADEAFRRAVRASPGQTMSDVRRRFLALDRRLVRLEKYVTSSRYKLDREFHDLERDALDR